MELVASKRGADGRWTLDVRYPGRMPVDLGEEEGRRNRWITLRVEGAEVVFQHLKASLPMSAK